MNTVIYIDVVRNKKKMIGMLIYTAAFLVVCFVLSLIIDFLFPAFNVHLDFPQAIDSFLLFYEWNEHLYINIWNMLAFILPFVFVYLLMVGYACGIVEEEEFETLSYMRSLGIGRETIIISKLIVRLVWSFALCATIFLTNLIFFLILNQKKMISVVGIYSVKLFLLGLFHLTIALFIASCSIREKNSTIACGSVILLEFVLARFHSYIRLLADGLFISGRKYNEIEWIYVLSDKIASFDILCPVKLCYPGQSVSLSQGICLAIIGIVFCVAGYSIHTRDRVVFRNR